MSDRSSYDAPATVLALVAGLLIIAVALPFTIQAFPETLKSYDVIWGAETADQATLTVPAESGSFTTQVSAPAIQPASIHAEVGACRDTFDPSTQSGQKAAILAYKLEGTRNGTTQVLKEGSFTCATKDAGNFDIPLGGHYDFASVQSKSAEIASKILWVDAAKGNETVAYKLTVTPSRAAASSPGGLPVGLPGRPATTLAAGITLTLTQWNTSIRLHQQEALR